VSRTFKLAVSSEEQKNSNISVQPPIVFFFIPRNIPRPPVGQGLFIFTRFLDLTQRRTTVGRTPLDEWSARRRDLYLTTHNNHRQTDRQTSMPPGGIRTHNLSRRAAEDLLFLRPRGHRDRYCVLIWQKYNLLVPGWHKLLLTINRYSLRLLYQRHLVKSPYKYIEGNPHIMLFHFQYVGETSTGVLISP